ncbi:MAG: DUF4831 family protein [Bacteroidales bacterium]|nr:DUF4831 family protein [Bacteroidales bacterium]
MMKNCKINVFAALCFAAISSMTAVAQNYSSFPVSKSSDVSNGIVYNLPKTDLVIKFKVEKTTRTKGIYADNAYLLGIDAATLKNAVTYRIVEADICEKISADADKRYIFTADNKVNMEKSPFGTIKSVTVQGSNLKLSPNPGHNTDGRQDDSRMRQPVKQSSQSSSLPIVPTYEQRLMKQGLLTKYPQMTPEKAVAEIKRLREKQIELLSGGWEGTYMNTTVDFMYKQLDEIISSYVSLFTGIENTVTEEYVFIVTPEKPIIMEEDLIVPVCKFSETNGLMDLNEKGEGVKINARIHSYVSTDENTKNNALNTLTDKQKAKFDKEGTGVYYIIPQTAKVTLQGVDMINSSKIVKLMQYGNISFTTSHNSNLLFDENTGELLRM